MVPIGIVTRNRVQYLDVTLRSLSATDLPTDVPVTVFDDVSDNPFVKRYLTSNARLNMQRNWPGHATWRKAGLAVIQQADGPPKGVNGRVHWQSLGNTPRGVVEGSCEAVRRMFKAHPDAPAVILLQDDVIFNANWYERLCVTAQTHEFPQPLGVLSGCKLNQVYSALKGQKSLPPVLASGITAQCLYITRAAHNKLDMFKLPQRQRKQFDDMLKRRVSNNGMWAGVILPFVCQHFGVQSQVRPTRTWSSRKNGRIGFYAYPPYVVAKEVADLRGKK